MNHTDFLLNCKNDFPKGLDDVTEAVAERTQTQDEALSPKSEFPITKLKLVAKLNQVICEQSYQAIKAEILGQNLVHDQFPDDVSIWWKPLTPKTTQEDNWSHLDKYMD